MKDSYRADQFGFLGTPYGHAWWGATTRAKDVRKRRRRRKRKR